MDNQNINDFEQIPNSFLSEIDDKEFLNSIKETTENAKQEFKIELPKMSFENELEQDIFNKSQTENLSTPLSTPKGVNLNNLLNAELATDIYDTVITGVLMSVLKAVEIETNKSEISLTAKEKNTLKPIVEECIKDINIEFKTPWEALFWTTAIIFGTKIVVNKGQDIIKAINKPSTQKKEVTTKKTTTKKTATAQTELFKEGEKPLSKYMKKKLGINE
jgi:hypothetical protein